MSSSENPLVRFTILLFAVIFLGGFVFAWFDVITHENMLTNPEFEFASGLSMSGLLFSPTRPARLAAAPKAIGTKRSG